LKKKPEQISRKVVSHLHRNKRYAIYESHRKLSCYPELASAYLCCVTGREGNGYLSDPARHLSNTMLKPGGLISYGRPTPAFQGGGIGHLLRRLSILISCSVGGSEAY